MERSSGQSRPLLADVRVLDVSIWRPGPYATRLLADLGADVIKVEPPGGDPMRAFPDLFAGLHAGKRGVVLDLKDDGDRERALRLAADADVFVEGYRPGVADRLGLGVTAVRARNQAIVYCSVSGFGQTGPLRDVPGHDLDYQAWAGMLAPDGGAPVVPAVPVADLAGGMAAAFAVCAALFGRERAGEGERIDLGLADVLATWTGVEAPVAEGLDPSVRGVPGYGVFECGDHRWLALGVVTEDHFWRSLCQSLGLAEAGGPDLTHLDYATRVARRGELQGLLADRLRARSRDEVVEDLLDRGVPVAPVIDRVAMAELAHFRERGAVTTARGAGPATGFPVLFEAHPARRGSPAPALDEHRGATFLPR